MPKHILITGASGMIGTSLTRQLMLGGHTVAHLGRKAQAGSVPTFVWNPDRGYFDPAALEGVDTIVHLAGANVNGKRWSKAWKQEILDSRLKSTSLLRSTLATHPHNVKAVVAASAIGYYGFQGNEWKTETSAAGTDFLADVVKQWEASMDGIQELSIRLVKLRIGIVLGQTAGALPELARPIRWGVGAALGDGTQYMSWIHENDLIRLFERAITHPEMRGVYNAVAPNPVTNAEFTALVARQLHRPLWLPPVPSFALRILVGQMAEILVNGCKVSTEKASAEGFIYRFESAEDALKDLLL